MTRDQITRRFRKVAWGRLYWKSKNPHWRVFNSDDVAIVRNGTTRIHYQSIDALIRDIEHSENLLK